MTYGEAGRQKCALSAYAGKLEYVVSAINSGRTCQVRTSHARLRRTWLVRTFHARLLVDRRQPLVAVPVDRREAVWLLPRCAAVPEDVRLDAQTRLVVERG